MGTTYLKRLTAFILVICMFISLGDGTFVVLAKNDENVVEAEEAGEAGEDEETGEDKETAAQEADGADAEILEEVPAEEQTNPADEAKGKKAEAGKEDGSSSLRDDIQVLSDNEEETLLEDIYKIYFIENKQEVETCSVTYTGEELTPEIVVKNPDDEEDILDLTEKDCPYVVEYKDNINAGKATVTVYEEDNEDNKLTAEFTIDPQSIKDAKITLSKTSYTCNGSARKPGTTVVTKAGKTLKKDTDYTVTYSNNTKVGTATVKVTGKGNYTGTVSTSFTIQLAKVKISSLTPFYNGITVKWGTVSDASKYVIYRSTKKSSGFKKVTTITNVSKQSYKDKGLKLGTTYYYKIRAYKGSTYTESSVKSKKVVPAKAVITKVSPSNCTTLKITWDKVAGASGYYVYRSTKKNGTYKKIATVKKGTLSYKDTKRTVGKTYYYKVAAYRKENLKKYTGVKSAVVSGKAAPLKVTSFKVDQKSGKAVLSWKAQSDVTGYKIYRSTSKNSGYKLVKTTKKTTWTNSGLTPKTKYYYKIRAYKTSKGKTVYGEYSSIKSITPGYSRSSVVEQAQSWLGSNEYGSGHAEILRVYNTHEPLARNYAVKDVDAWCATFVSSVAIKVKYTEIMPTECSCGEMVKLYQQLGRWKEDDSYTPKKGDVIFYDWDDDGKGDNTGWPDHVGIVEKVSGNTITTIEGNYSDTVKRRTISVNGKYIRGYGVPKYTVS